MKHRHTDEPEFEDKTVPDPATDPVPVPVGTEPPVPVGTEPKPTPREEEPLGPEAAKAKELIEMLQARPDAAGLQVSFLLNQLGTMVQPLMELPVVETPPLVRGGTLPAEPNPDNTLPQPE